MLTIFYTILIFTILFTVFTLLSFIFSNHSYDEDDECDYGIIDKRMADAVQSAHSSQGGICLRHPSKEDKA